MSAPFQISEFGQPATASCPPSDSPRFPLQKTTRPVKLLEPDNFDAVRLMAAFFVLYSHQLALTSKAEPIVLGVHSLGGLGVLIFFSISGYLVSQSWVADPHLLRFGARRLLRIWPGYAVSVLFCSIVIGPMVSSLSLREYLTNPGLQMHLDNLTFRMREMLPIQFDGSPLPTIMNGSLWTIPIEMKCYALMGLLGLSGLLGRRWTVLVLTVAVVAEYAVLTSRGERLIDWLQWMPEPRFSVEFALFFLAGVLLHRFGLLADGPLRWLTVTLCLGLGIAAYLVGRPLLTLWFIVPTLAVSVGLASTPVLRRAGRYGDLSFGLYLYAFPVQQTLLWISKNRLPWGVALALVIATTTVLAFLSWHLVEKHALRWKPRRPSAPRTVLPSGVPIY